MYTYQIQIYTYLYDPNSDIQGYIFAALRINFCFHILDSMIVHIGDSALNYVASGSIIYKIIYHASRVK